MGQLIPRAKPPGIGKGNNTDVIKFVAQGKKMLSVKAFSVAMPAKTETASSLPRSAASAGPASQAQKTVDAIRMLRPNTIQIPGQYPRPRCPGAN